MPDMQIREGDTTHEEGAQNRQRGPDWQFMLGLSGVLIMVLYAGFNALAMAQLADVKQQLSIHDIARQEARTDITRLEMDMGYIKTTLDEIRQILRTKP